MEKITFCTLFDSYYIDKGIALYRSLERVSQSFQLYIFCFDSKSYEVLGALNLKSAILIKHSEFENEELLELKKTRSKAEYCWTCTPIIIEYVIKTYGEKSCTYLDSDLYFYSNPQILFDEIDHVAADVVITEHRFKNNAYGSKLEKRNGKYCVQFNFFRNSEKSLKVLEWWKERCLEWCFDIPEPTRMGDQKYLNSWTRDFDGVHELQHLGGGVAPWNLEQYTLSEKSDDILYMKNFDGEKFQLVFYHFQNIRYMPNGKVNIKSQTKNKKLKYSIYIPYLKEIEEIRNVMKSQFGLDFEPKKLYRSSNPIMRFLQKHFASYKIQSFSDILDLKNLDKYM